MIKFILMALPIYTMFCYKLPQHSINKLQSSIAKFWHYHGMDKSRKIHWESFDNLSCPKVLGGLEIRNLKLFNQALLAKNAWRLMLNPPSVWA